MPLRAKDWQRARPSLTFTDRHGVVLGTVAADGEEAIDVPLSQVSPWLVQAVLAAEDQRFDGGAIDGLALIRVLWDSLRSGRVVGGASTLSQQLVRLRYRTPRTVWGKLTTIWLAWRVQAGSTREEILTAYLNHVPMGGNVYGVEAAARHYLGMSAAELNVARASLLAALPNAPTHLHPRWNWEGLKQRQAYVLARMVARGYLSPALAARAHQETVTLAPVTTEGAIARHWLERLAREPHPPGSILRTTLDRTLQEFVEAQVRQVTAALGDVQGAAIVVDNRTGEVLAYVGSPDYFAYSTDGVQAPRQAGSTLKPFLYQLAFALGELTPTTVLADRPAHYGLPGGRLYSPTDYSERFRGDVLPRFALANSLNLPAVRTLERVGVDRFLTRLRELGFAHLTHDARHYGLGLALGSGEVTLWELAQAYTALANGGIRRTLTPWPDQPAQDVTLPEPELWRLVTDMLADRHSRGAAFGRSSVLNTPFGAAVKTGTSSAFRDNWTVGFTSEYTVATWVGRFDGQPLAGISGVAGAAPLWRNILGYLHRAHPPAPFPKPHFPQQGVCSLPGKTPNCPAQVWEYTWGKVPAPPPPCQIVQPSPQSHFLVAAGDRLEAVVQGVSPRWFWNGTPLSGQNRVFWPATYGQHTLEVHCQEGRDRVTVTVSPYRPAPTRGFSRS
ncbi:MAG: penicillin-binding protein 1C [Pseudanabaenaceae cyanobacterium]